MNSKLTRCDLKAEINRSILKIWGKNMNKAFYLGVLLILTCSIINAKGKLNEAYLVHKEYKKLTNLIFKDQQEAMDHCKDLLKNGNKYQKEAVLDLFQKKHIVALVPSVIEAILDNTVSPSHGDTGWGRIYHQAATAMSQFAYSKDHIGLKKRGLDKFSFHKDVGTANEERRKEVYNNWLQWWENYKKSTK